MQHNITHAEAAVLLGVCVNTVRNMLRDGRLPYAEQRNPRQRGGRTRWILDRATVERVARGFEVRPA